MFLILAGVNQSDDATALSQPIFLEWASASGATKYHLVIDDDPGFGSPDISNYAAVTSYSASGLNKDGTAYYWRVRAGNDCGNWSAWSDVRDFTTECVTLDHPALTSPGNEAELDVREDVVLTWGAVAGATDYTMQVSEDEAFSSTIEEYVHAFSGYTITYPLQQGTTYYWRVATNNSCGTGVWSAAWNFDPICPPAGTPELVSPSNNAVNVTQPIMLDWTDVAEAEKYHVQVDNDFDFSSLDVDDENIISSEVTLPNLLEGVSYYWRIQVHNGCQWGDWTSSWSFMAGEQTDIAQIILDKLPENYTLRQNYPNPFNPKTTMEFALPRAEHVTLEIHNILGEKVETLLSRHLSAGYYSIIWDASSVPTGIYFYKIQAGTFSETRKMTLIK